VNAEAKTALTATAAFRLAGYRFSSCISCRCSQSDLTCSAFSSCTAGLLHIAFGFCCNRFSEGVSCCCNYRILILLSETFWLVAVSVAAAVAPDLLHLF
jgi:hypothetical protein